MLHQKFQQLNGELHEDGRSLALTDAIVNGTKISFRVDGKQYEAEVMGEELNGTIDGEQSWKATKVQS